MKVDYKNDVAYVTTRNMGFRGIDSPAPGKLHAILKNIDVCHYHA